MNTHSQFYRYGALSTASEVPSISTTIVERELNISGTYKTLHQKQQENVRSFLIWLLRSMLSAHMGSVSHHPVCFLQTFLEPFPVTSCSEALVWNVVCFLQSVVPNQDGTVWTRTAQISDLGHSRTGKGESTGTHAHTHTHTSHLLTIIFNTWLSRSYFTFLKMFC